MTISSRMIGVLLGLLAIPFACGCASSGRFVEPFNGKNLDGWLGLTAENAWQTASEVVPDPKNPKKFKITPGTGLLVNGPNGRTCNLYTAEMFGDVEVHIEFMVPKDSNSGVYFQGLYEVQVLDSFGHKNVKHSDCGGIYQRWINNKGVDGHAPRVNASKPPGQWQSFDVIFRAPRFDDSGKKIANARFERVIHNGVIVHEDVELKGPTRSHMNRAEQPLGPLMLQGDHGPVVYRNIRIRSLR